MLEILLILLVILWLTGYINVSSFPLPDYVLFNLNGQPITLWNLIIFFLIVGAIGILPSPIREIAGVLLILWVLSILGILALGSLSSLLVLAIIIGIVVALFNR